MMSTMTTTAEVLRNAATIIERDGWTQGEAYSDTGRCCAIGAVEASVEELGAPSSSAYGALYRHLTSKGYDGIVDFNDEPGRTADEVIAELREAAAAAAAAEAAEK